MLFHLSVEAESKFGGILKIFRSNLHFTSSDAETKAMWAVRA